MRDFLPAGAAARYLLLALVAALGAALAPAGQAYAQDAGQPTRAQVTMLGRAIESLARSRDFAAIADLFVDHDVTCPVDPVYRAQACTGLADGTVVAAYRIGLMNSEPGVVDRAGLEAFLGEYLDLVPAASATLQTIALRGFGDCPTCALIVLTADAPGSDAPQAMFLFQVTAAGRVFSAIGGLVPPDGGAMLTGGAWSGIAFVDPDSAAPFPPGTGSGGAPSNGTWPVSPVPRAIALLGAAIAAAKAVRTRRS